MILETFDKEQYEKDLIEDAKAEGIIIGKINGEINAAIAYGIDKARAIAHISKNYSISEAEAEKLFENYKTDKYFKE